MPIMSRTYRKSFKWREVDGAPVAAVTVLNGRGWILCCPLCGCIHEVRAGQVSGSYKPDCLLRRLAALGGAHGPANWRALLALWQDAHPQAAAADTVILLDTAAVEALDKAAQDAQRAARAKRPAAARPRKQRTEKAA